ncbi:MAG TPA: hypothetical protein VMY78_16550 [Solirubrobacteraceae bacterium]|nr:hypothetical protein [Solirubrobacteraceae bacterium]
MHVALVVACAVILLSGCGSDGPETAQPGDAPSPAITTADAPAPVAEPPPPPPPPPPPATPTVDDYDENSKNLAIVDGEGASDLRAVQQRSRALDVLEKKCPEAKRSRLADYATVTKQEAAKEDIEVTTLQALRGVNKSIPPRLIGEVKCQDQFAAYIALVVSGVDP